jgi:hypothetical protein
MPFAIIFTYMAGAFGKDAKNLGFNLVKYGAWSAYVLIALGVFFAAIFTLLDSVAVSAPSLAVDVWGWFMPANAAGCLTVIVSARVLRAILQFKISMATKKLEQLRSA